MSQSASYVYNMCHVEDGYFQEQVIFTSPCTQQSVDGYFTAMENPAEIDETARSGTVGGGNTRSGQEYQEWVPFMGDPCFPLEIICF